MSPRLLLLSKNVDFLAVTDHSNSFDNANTGVLNVNSSSSVEWQQGHKAADSVTDGTFVVFTASR